MTTIPRASDAPTAGRSLVGALIAATVLVAAGAASAAPTDPAAAVPAITATDATPAQTVAPPAAAPEPALAATDTAIAYDPWHGVNRGIFGFSMGLDHAVIRPITHTYMRVTPQPLQNRVSDFVYNLGEPNTAINDMLQGHPKRAGKTTARFVVNSTVGILGLFDVAAGMGIPSHDADFGQTLGRYGAQAGPYMYVPVVGPLDLRDGVGRVADFFLDPVSLFTGGITTPFGATRTGLTAVDTRAAGDPAFRALKDATDPYVTVRSAYTQHRVFVVQTATGAATAAGDTTNLPDFDSPPAKN